MKKLNYVLRFFYVMFVTLTLIGLSSCDNDDDDNPSVVLDGDYTYQIMASINGQTVYKVTNSVKIKTTNNVTTVSFSIDLPKDGGVVTLPLSIATGTAYIDNGNVLVGAATSQVPFTGYLLSTGPQVINVVADAQDYTFSLEGAAEVQYNSAWYSGLKGIVSSNDTFDARWRGLYTVPGADDQLIEITISSSAL